MGNVLDTTEGLRSFLSATSLWGGPLTKEILEDAFRQVENSRFTVYRPSFKFLEPCAHNDYSACDMLCAYPEQPVEYVYKDARGNLKNI